MKIKVKITTSGNMKYFGCASGTIKEIEFEDYIRCVVASEMGNAAIEACKAQAVASRTFACARGVLEGKVISDDAAKAQAFRADRTNYKNCNAAVAATEGQVLTYGGKYIGAYFSHSNGGRTYSSEEVWGNKRNYLVARKDAWTAATGTKKNGHGIGLSQAGAKYAAEHGVGYREILSFYYPYTTIKHLEMKQDEDYMDVVKQAEEAIKKAIKEIGEML